MAEVIRNRYGFVVLFDVEDGSLNGDPDAGNPSGTDPKSGYGTVTNVRSEHRIRNYVETLKEDEPGYKIYTREDVPLGRSDNTAYIELKTDEKGIKELEKKNSQVDQKIRDFMCRNFLDIRTFGAVMTVFVRAVLNCGQVRGPIQLGFARSIDPIVNQEVTITRVVITTEEDTENKSMGMGRKNIVSHALYRAEGYISVNLARKFTGFSEEDPELLWSVITNTPEIDHSAARRKMAARRLTVFRRNKELGDCPAYELFDAVGVKKNEEVECPRKYRGHTVVVYRDQIPVTVEASEKI